MMVTNQYFRSPAIKNQQKPPRHQPEATSDNADQLGSDHPLGPNGRLPLHAITTPNATEADSTIGE